MSRPNDKPVILTAATLLSELKQAHAQVRACLQEMETATSRSAADRLEYTRARFHISRASMYRRSRFNQACAELSKNASPQETLIIEQLRAGDRALMAKSAAHVMHWTSPRVEADWLGYCTASRRLRKQMTLEIDAEDNLLLPLLARRSCRQAADRHALSHPA